MAKTLPGVTEVLDKMIAWGKAQPTVRAMLLSSSLTRPDGPVDLLTDYDLILAVTDPERFAQTDDWISDYGTPMVRWGDQSELLGLITYFRGVIYEDYVKIDYSIWPDVLLEKIAEAPELPDELDAGYQILLDKDQRTTGWKSPTYHAFIPAKPTEAQFQAHLAEMWWSLTYIAKSLWRDEMVFAHWLLEHEIKNGTLRQLLEWRTEIDYDWTLKPGVFGRGIKPRLSTETWTELESTYVGAEIEANWEALSRTIKLMRRIAGEVGDAFGYAYPQAQEDKVIAYLNFIRELPPPAPSTRPHQPPITL